MTCQSTTSCTAVGLLLAGTTYQTLVETFNGAAWQIVLSANLGTDGSELFSPQGPSAGKCIAMGERAAPGRGPGEPLGTKTSGHFTLT